MKPLVYRMPFKNNKAAAWLHHCRNLSGAYVIRRSSTHEILYIGESRSGMLGKVIKRHFYSWDDEKRKHFTCNAKSVEVAVRLTPPNSAVAAQNNLIENLQPKKNKYGFREDVGF